MKTARAPAMFERLRWWPLSSNTRMLMVAAIVTLVVLYAALLRFDALTLIYGPVQSPRWLRVAQQSRAAHSLLRPAGFTWNPAPWFPHADGPASRYRSDPYTYLKRAREMRSFYEAHRREPVFPFVTRVFLRALGNQDVAVSFAAAAFSILAVLATFLLGAEAFGYAVGIASALALAIEYDMVSSGVEGWRDDAFTCAVVLSAYAMLRVRRAPSLGNAVLLGIVGGIACLVRITSVSFLVPGLLWLFLAPSASSAGEAADTADATVRRSARWPVALAAVLMAAVVAPFAFNCWRAFGDPLYSINVHADVYRAAEGQAIDASQTARQYVVAQLRSQPARTLDTIALGMTAYPFENKWQGFRPWAAWLGPFLSWASLVGLVLLAGSVQGRGLLLVLASSLVPYAVTWKLASDWRFTEHSYPFFLIAASVAVASAVNCSRPSWLRSVVVHRPTPRATALWGGVLTGVAVITWGIVWALPVWSHLETLRANEPAMIVAGSRDAAFFLDGWSRPHSAGSVTTRTIVGARAAVRLPLPKVQDYDLTLRLDPEPRPTTGSTSALPSVSVLLNGQTVGVLNLIWNPERVGSYQVHVPSAVTRAGFNRLAIVPSTTGASHVRVALWYVRVRPPGA